MSFVKSLIENPHPVYVNNVNYWNFLLSSYEGGKDYTGVDSTNTNNTGIIVNVNGKPMSQANSSNLFEHPKERNEDYARRIKKSYFYNYCAPIIDIYTNHLFKQSVIAEYGAIEGLVEIQSDNIDLMDSNVDEFRSNLAQLAQVYGHMFVLVDAPNVQGEMSLQQRMDNNSFPYFCLIHPQNVLNWSLDRFGKPYWVLVREISDMNSDPMNFNKDLRGVPTYRLWERDSWTLFDAKMEVIDSGFHNIGEVPIVCVYDKKSYKEKNFLGISSLADISFIARDVYNLCSELGQIISDQTFAFLTLQGKGDDFSAIEISTNKALVYPEGMNVPTYVSPDSSNADVLMRQINVQIDKMFQLAKLEAGSASFNGQKAVQESGVSKAWDFNQTNSALGMKASNLEDAEGKLWDYFARWEGREWDGSVTYPKEFNVQSLNDELEEAKSSLTLGLGKTFGDEVKKQIVQKKFPQMTEEKIDQIFQEIESQTPGSEARSLINRIPGLFTANSSGSTNGGINGRGN